MGSWPDVNPGQAFEPSAQLENDVRHLVNRRGRSGVRANSGGVQVENICINAYNPSNTAIPSGTVVTFDGAAMVEGAVQIVALNSGSSSEAFSNWAIVDGEIPGKGFGSVLVSGVAIVPLNSESEDSGDYVVPVGGGDEFVRSAVGIARILRVFNSYALILVGCSSGGDYEAGNAIDSDAILGGTISVNYNPGSGISILPVVGSTNGAQTISANITGDGTNISVSGGSAGNPLVISYIGSSGSGELKYPPYSALTFGGGAPEYGLGHTFILPVKAGDVGFYDDGGGAVGKWTNVSGSTSQTLTAGTAYRATENGWLRISVVDNGIAPGACMGFYSSTGGFPLYKYGSFSVGGIGYPDYIALAGGTASNSLGSITDDDYEEGDPVPGPSNPPQNPKIGITSFLPVPAGAAIKYYASVAVLVRFAPCSGGGHYYYDLSNELEWTPNCAGWLRISILDDGSHSSDCFRLYVGGVQWSDAVPLYKCGTFQGGATGISSSISGTTVTISLTGGSGSVKFVAGTNVTISGVTNGVYSISASGGGGSGFIPNWSNSGHTDVLPISSSTYGSGYTANADGWIYACAYFDPADDRMRYKHYDAHVVVNQARMKVSELKLPSGTAFIKVAGSSTKYYRDPSEDWSNDPYAEHPYYSYFAWSAGGGGSLIYTSSVTPVIGDSTYIYDNEDEEFVDNQADVEDTNSAAYAVGVGSAITIPVRSGATIYFIATADGNAFYSRYAMPPCFCVFYSSNPPATP